MAFQTGSGGFTPSSNKATLSNERSYSMGSSPSGYGPGGQYNSGGGGTNREFAPSYAQGGPMGSAGSRPGGPAAVGVDPRREAGSMLDRYLSTFPTEMLPFMAIPGVGSLMGLTAIMNALGVQGEVSPMGNAGSATSPEQRNQIIDAAMAKFGASGAAGGIGQLTGQASNYTNFMRELEQALAAQKTQYGQAASARGYDFDTFADVFNPELDRQRGSVMDSLDQYLAGPGLLKTDLDPYKFAFSQYITPGTGESVLSGEEQRRRGQYGQAIDAYAPTGFEYAALPDTYDDSAITSLLGSQFESARGRLENDQRRNLLTSTGYNAALRDLTEQQTRGGATLQELGRGYLSSARSDLSNIAGTGRSAASSYQLGQNFDPNQYQGQINDYLNTFQSTLPGKLGSEAGTLINYLGAIQRGGAAQGVTNPGGSGLDNYIQNQGAGSGNFSGRNVPSSGRF